MVLQTLGNKLWKLSVKQLKDMVHTSYPGIFQRLRKKRKQTGEVGKPKFYAE